MLEDMEKMEGSLRGVGKGETGEGHCVDVGIVGMLIKQFLAKVE